MCGVLSSFISSAPFRFPISAILSSLIGHFPAGPFHFPSPKGIRSVESRGEKRGGGVTRLPAAREGPGSNRAADKSLCFHENHCDTQLWARAVHWMLSEYQPYD